MVSRLRAARPLIRWCMFVSCVPFRVKSHYWNPKKGSHDMQLCSLGASIVFSFRTFHLIFSNDLFVRGSHRAFVGILTKIHWKRQKSLVDFVEIIDFLGITVCWCLDPRDRHERRVPDAEPPPPGATKHSLEGVIDVKGMETMDELAKGWKGDVLWTGMLILNLTSC